MLHRAGSLRLLTLVLSAAALLALVRLAAAQEAEAAAAAPGASRFARKTVVVTGANRGLGLELATQLVAAGARVVGTAREPAEAQELAATGARVLPLDVTEPDSVAAFAKALGDVPVALLFNNAGVSGRAWAELATAERARRVIDVNTLGPMRVTEALLPRLRAADGAIVANMSSRLGSLNDNTIGGYGGYRESKVALNMYTRSLAAEHRADGILAVCLSPGWVRTDMGGPDAPLAPEESVRGLLRVLEGLEPAQSGLFWNHDGTRLEW